MIQIFGVIGDPIGHSLSPEMHNAAYHALGLDCIYLPFHVRAERLRDAIEGAGALGIRGFNVTVPHKVAVMELVEPDLLARKIGAVNTIDFATLKGYNTDVAGITGSLESAGVDLRGKRVLLLGAGGAARAAAFASIEAGCKLVIANRTRSKGEKLADELGRGVNAIGLEDDEIGPAIA
ncbi:shikimate dehydrogenase, partial [Methanosarcinales archaeon]